MLSGRTKVKVRYKMPTDNPNVGIAFALVIGAGAATALGAMVVFFPSLVKYANRKTLAGALGLSAGVMTYVSFVEIFQKSHQSFLEAEFEEDEAYMYATLCFFGGVIFMVTLNYCVTSLLRGEHNYAHSHGPEDSQKKTNNTNSVSRTSNEQATTAPAATHHDIDAVAPCACCSDDPVKDLEAIKNMAEELERDNNHNVQAKEEPVEDQGGHNHNHNDHCMHEHQGEEQKTGDTGDEVEQSIQDSDDEGERQQRDKDEEEAKLMRMSINTALAIGLHNFPEGLATFVATLNDPKVGTVLAVAIAIHNVPEGLCVALPIFYATGNRWKAFWWAILSGASEPLAALLGWAILANSFNDTMYAILFGLVAGMMVIISVRELLPTAHRYDPEDTVVTYCFIIGMGIMALSLVLFLI